MDVGILGEPLTHPDIPRKEVVEASGYSSRALTLRRKTVPLPLKLSRRAGRSWQGGCLKKGRLHGVFGMGGGTGTAIVTFIMRSLPFGLPKLVVSTVASRDIREYIGTKDIVMFHSVADILGFNEFMRLILESGIACRLWHDGERSRCLKKEKPMVAVTAYGINSHARFRLSRSFRKEGMR